MDNFPDIALVYDEQIPSSAFNEFDSIVEELGVSYAKESSEHGPFAGMGWLLPTAVILFFGKSYFDAFFKEMGKDHYNLIKKGLQSLRRSFLSDTTGFKYQRISSPASKIPKQSVFSVVFSIMSMTKQGHRVKFLFPENITQDDFQECIESFFRTMSENYSAKDNDDDLTTQLNIFSKPQHTILIRYNKESKKMEVVDPMQEIRTRHK